MITKKSRSRPFTHIWPYTPDPSPPLEATLISTAIDDDFKMATDPSRSRPNSIASKREGGILSPGGRPTLDDVLNGRAPAPYTLAAYTAFLSQQHCLETLEFVTEARKYGAKFDEASAHFCGMPMTTDTDDGFELMQDWIRLMDIYVKPGAPREINLPSEERDDLIDEPYEPRPPKPETLEPAIQRMRDLMSDSIFIPFCNSVKHTSQPIPYSPVSDFSRSDFSYDELSSSHRRQPSQKRRSPPTSSIFQPSRSPPQNRNTFTSNMNRNSGSRLSVQPSNNSGYSESALTDDSGSGGSPSAGDMDVTMTPPLTPPTSDIPHAQFTSPLQPTSHSTKPSRSESGGWKRVGMKFFSTKKRGSSEREEQ